MIAYDGLYRKSVKMEIGTPAKENRADKIKGEAWGRRTSAMDLWQRLRRLLLKNSK